MCKKILVIAPSRINESDTANNGLLLRSLFSSWPSANIGQIFSGGDNQDSGFFDSYFCLGANERIMGGILSS